MEKLAPIILFCRGGVDSISLALSHISAANLAKRSDLFIVCDAAKIKGLELDELCKKNSSEFHSINSEIVNLSQKFYSESITKVLNKFGKAVILEDNILISEAFLEYINGALDFYRDDKKVFAVSGFNFDSYQVPSKYKHDVFLTKTQACPTAWGVWQDRWQKVELKFCFAKKNEMLSDFLVKNLTRHIAESGSYFLLPVKTFVRNLALQPDAKHYDELSLERKRINFLPFFAINNQKISFENSFEMLKTNDAADASYTSFFSDPVLEKKKRAQKKKRIKYFLLGVLLFEAAVILAEIIF